MNNYLIVYHFWFMDSKGFEKEVIKRSNKKQAKQYANSKCFEKQGDFKK